MAGYAIDIGHAHPIVARACVVPVLNAPEIYNIITIWVVSCFLEANGSPA